VRKKGQRAAASSINWTGTRHQRASPRAQQLRTRPASQEHRTHSEVNGIRTGGEGERGCAIPVLPSTQPETGARAHPRSTSSPFLLFLPPYYYCTVRLGPLSFSPQESSRTSQNIQISQQCAHLRSVHAAFRVSPSLLVGPRGSDPWVPNVVRDHASCLYQI
jgi:hypothetical protein